MEEISSSTPMSLFESIRQVDENGEFWTARQLAAMLEYVDYRNFLVVMRKAYSACQKSGQKGRDHFVVFNKMAQIGSGASKEVDDVRLTRYACYLIVQNADSEKEIVALGQTYFAVQTRLQEIQKMDEYNALQTEDAKRMFLRKELSEHNKYLASAAKGAALHQV